MPPDDPCSQQEDGWSARSAQAPRKRAGCARCFGGTGAQRRSASPSPGRAADPAAAEEGTTEDAPALLDACSTESSPEGQSLSTPAGSRSLRSMLLALRLRRRSPTSPPQQQQQRQSRQQRRASRGSLMLASGQPAPVRQHVLTRKPERPALRPSSDLSFKGRRACGGEEEAAPHARAKGADGCGEEDTAAASAGGEPVAVAAAAAAGCSADCGDASGADTWPLSRVSMDWAGDSTSVTTTPSTVRAPHSRAGATPSPAVTAAAAPRGIGAAKPLQLLTPVVDVWSSQEPEGGRASVGHAMGGSRRSSGGARSQEVAGLVAPAVAPAIGPTVPSRRTLHQSHSAPPLEPARPADEISSEDECLAGGGVGGVGLQKPLPPSLAACLSAPPRSLDAPIHTISTASVNSTAAAAAAAATTPAAAAAPRCSFDGSAAAAVAAAPLSAASRRSSGGGGGGAAVAPLSRGTTARSLAGRLGVSLRSLFGGGLDAAAKPSSSDAASFSAADAAAAPSSPGASATGAAASGAAALGGGAPSRRSVLSSLRVQVHPAGDTRAASGALPLHGAAAPCDAPAAATSGGGGTSSGPNSCVGPLALTEGGGIVSPGGVSLAGGPLSSSRGASAASSAGVARKPSRGPVSMRKWAAAQLQDEPALSPCSEPSAGAPSPSTAAASPAAASPAGAAAPRAGGLLGRLLGRDVRDGLLGGAGSSAGGTSTSAAASGSGPHPLPSATSVVSDGAVLRYASPGRGASAPSAASGAAAAAAGGAAARPVAVMRNTLFSPDTPGSPSAAAAGTAAAAFSGGADVEAAGVGSARAGWPGRLPPLQPLLQRLRGSDGNAAGNGANAHVRPTSQPAVAAILAHGAYAHDDTISVVSGLSNSSSSNSNCRAHRAGGSYSDGEDAARRIRRGMGAGGATAAAARGRARGNSGDDRAAHHASRHEEEEDRRSPPLAALQALARRPRAHTAGAYEPRRGSPNISYADLSTIVQRAVLAVQVTRSGAAAEAAVSSRSRAIRAAPFAAAVELLQPGGGGGGGGGSAAPGGPHSAAGGRRHGVASSQGAYAPRGGSGDGAGYGLHGGGRSTAGGDGEGPTLLTLTGSGAAPFDSGGGAGAAAAAAATGGGIRDRTSTEGVPTGPARVSEDHPGRTGAVTGNRSSEPVVPAQKQKTWDPDTLGARLSSGAGAAAAAAGTAGAADSARAPEDRGLANAAAHAAPAASGESTRVAVRVRLVLPGEEPGDGLGGGDTEASEGLAAEAQRAAVAQRRRQLLSAKEREAAQAREASPRAAHAAGPRSGHRRRSSTNDVPQSPLDDVPASPSAFAATPSGKSFADLSALLSDTVQLRMAAGGGGSSGSPLTSASGGVGTGSALREHRDRASHTSHIRAAPFAHVLDMLQQRQRDLQATRQQQQQQQGGGVAGGSSLSQQHSQPRLLQRAAANTAGARASGGTSHLLPPLQLPGGLPDSEQLLSADHHAPGRSPRPGSGRQGSPAAALLARGGGGLAGGGSGRASSLAPLLACGSESGALGASAVAATAAELTSEGADVGSAGVEGVAEEEGGALARGAGSRTQLRTARRAMRRSVTLSVLARGLGGNEEDLARQLRELEKAIVQL